MDSNEMRAMQRYWEECTGTFWLTDPYARKSCGGKPVKNEDTSKARKERKERARMLTAQRMAEIQAQGGNCKRKKKRK